MLLQLKWPSTDIFQLKAKICMPFFRQCSEWIVNLMGRFNFLKLFFALKQRITYFDPSDGSAKRSYIEHMQLKSLTIKLYGYETNGRVIKLCFEWLSEEPYLKRKCSQFFSPQWTRSVSILGASRQVRMPRISIPPKSGGFRNSIKNAKTRFSVWLPLLLIISSLFFIFIRSN